jgi:hypothetical protein
VGSDVNGEHLSVRRSVKADREKMRRDKLNEQFLELASSLGKSFIFEFYLHMEHFPLIPGA